MALTLTEIAVMPSTGNKRMAIWKITGDAASYQINVRDLKMSKVVAAWTENVNDDTKHQIRVDTYDYVDGPVTIIELGYDGGALGLSKEHLLFVIGY